MQQRICLYLCFWRLVTQPKADKFSQVVPLSPKCNAVSGHCSKTWRQQSCDSFPVQNFSLKSFLLLPFFSFIVRAHILGRKMCYPNQLCSLRGFHSFIYSFIHSIIHSFPECSLPCAVEEEISVGLALVSAVTQLSKMTPQHTQRCPHQPEVISRQHSILQTTTI